MLQEGQVPPGWKPLLPSGCPRRAAGSSDSKDQPQRRTSECWSFEASIKNPKASGRYYLQLRLQSATSVLIPRNHEVNNRIPETFTVDSLS